MAVRAHKELIPRNVIGMQQEPGFFEQLSKNITRQGITNSTLNYLRVSGDILRWRRERALAQTVLVQCKMRVLTQLVVSLAVMCNPGTNARAHVEAQGVPAESAGLPEDDPVPEMAEDGCPAG